MQHSNRPTLLTFRRELRTAGTPAEAFLWTRLKGRQMNGMRFRRQFSVDCFILDFYCPECRLAVELDGAGHFTEEGRIYDEARTEYLGQLHGIRVIRFENREVFEHIDGVLGEIRGEMLQLPPPLARVLPL